jgi:hypothetical protein
MVSGGVVEVAQYGAGVCVDGGDQSRSIDSDGAVTGHGARMAPLRTASSDVSCLYAAVGLAVAGGVAPELLEMSGFLVASAASLSTSPAELIVMVVDFLLLSIRACSGVLGLRLTSRDSRILTSATVFFVALFIVLVVVRFKSLG